MKLSDQEFVCLKTYI